MVEEKLTTILFLIEKELERQDKVQKSHREKIESLDDEMKELKKNFDPVKAKVDSDSKSRESRNRHVVNTIIGLIIAAIFGWLGLK